MQQFENLVTRPGDRRLRLAFGGAVRAHHHRLGQFEIPVAIHIPDEAIDDTRGIVETIRLDGFGDFACGARGSRARSSGSGFP